MPPSRRLHRRPSTPNLNHHQSFTADPASPPETPTTSPQFSRKISLKPRHQDDPYFSLAPSLANDPNIKPVGNGHQFSYQPTLGPEQLSPRSSSSSSVAVEDSPGDESPGSASLGSLPNAPTASQSRYQAFLTRQSQSNDSDADEEDDDDEEDEYDDEDEEDEDEDEEGARDQRVTARPGLATGVSPAAALFWDFILEEVDPMDNTPDALDVLYPDEIESARSRSSSWHKDFRDLDRSMMRDLSNLNCSNEASDNEPEFDLEEDIFLKRQQEMRRLRRVSMSSSVGKRTHSELSDSDDDFGPLDVNEVGSSARRLRKRLHRGSLLFHDPPEQIEELDEPNSSEDEFQAGQSLAQELPYWTMEIMEMESS